METSNVTQFANGLDQGYAQRMADNDRRTEAGQREERDKKARRTSPPKIPFRFPFHHIIMNLQHLQLTKIQTQ